jgi:hypothetical protein
MQTVRDMHTTTNNHNDTRSLGDLFAELSRETSALVQSEVALAKAEMSQKASQVGQDVGWLAAGGALAYAGLLAVLAAVIIALDALLPLWLAALLVGLVAAGAGYFLVQKGLDHLKNASLTPNKTIATLKEDAAWAKEQLT